MSISSVDCRVRIAIKIAAVCLVVLGVIGTPSHAEGDDGVIHEIDYSPIASSVLKQGSSVYSATNIRSMDLAKAWCEGSEGDGVGEWIELRPTSRAIKAGKHRFWLKILPGFAKTDSLFLKNNRPSRINVIFNPISGSGKRLEKVIQLIDRPELQAFELPYEGDIDSITLVFQNVFQGTKYDDTCITEVHLYIAEGESNTKGHKLSFEEEIAKYQKERSEIELEEKLLRDNQAKAKAGNETSINSLMRLGNGYYIRGAEGGEILGELYLDIFVGYPERFLFVLSRQERIVQARIMKALKSPVTDKYSNKELLNKLVRARQNGVQYEFMTDLESAFRR